RFGLQKSARALCGGRCDVDELAGVWHWNHGAIGKNQVGGWQSHQKETRYAFGGLAETDAVNSGANSLGSGCGRSAHESVGISRPYHRRREIHRTFETLGGFHFGDAPRFPLGVEQTCIAVAQPWIPEINDIDVRQLDSKLLRFLF